MLENSRSFEELSKVKGVTTTTLMVSQLVKHQIEWLIYKDTMANMLTIGKVEVRILKKIKDSEEAIFDLEKLRTN